MRNTGLEEAQAGIKIARRNINNLRYTDDITLMAKKGRGTKEPLDDFQNTKITTSSPITLWPIDGETMCTMTDFYFLGLQNHCGW